jgi:hypothetical protein
MVFLGRAVRTAITVVRVSAVLSVSSSTDRYSTLAPASPVPAASPAPSLPAPACRARRGNTHLHSKLKTYYVNLSCVLQP